MEQKSWNTKTKLLMILFVTTIGVYLGFTYILPLFIPFMIAYFFAWCLLPIVNFLHRTCKIPKLLGGAIALLLLGTIILWLLFYLLSKLLNQIILLLQNLPIYISVATSRVDTFCNICDKFFRMEVGTAREFYDSNIELLLSTVKEKIMPLVTSRGLTIAIGFLGLVGILLIIIVCILLFIKDEEIYKRSFRKNLFYKDIHIVTSKMSKVGIAYLKAQGIILLMISVVCTMGLFVIENKYALLIGIGIGIFDAFPIFGSGVILIPWAIVEIINQDIYSAAILLTLYLGCQIIRQFLEPKLIGNSIGVKPVYTLIAMYVGVRLFGFSGFVLGPFGLIVVMTILEEVEKRMEDVSIE